MSWENMVKEGMHAKEHLSFYRLILNLEMPSRVQLCSWWMVRDYVHGRDDEVAERLPSVSSLLPARATFWNVGFYNFDLRNT